MKKNIILLIILLFIVTNGIHAQRYIITIDSLRTHFQNEKPYDVYDYYKKRANKFSKKDYKSLYYDQEMKKYLLEWLDQNQILDYKTNIFRGYLKGFDDESKVSLVKDYVKRELKLNPDSIGADEYLWKLYTDSAINFYAEKQRIILTERAEGEKKDILPDDGIMYFFSKITYPEGYKKIKYWWYQYEKPVSNNYTNFNILFICLLSMNDPEAQSEFDNIIKKYVQTNGKAYADDYGIGLINCLQVVDNAYGVRKMVELLPVQTEIAGLTGIDGTFYDPLDYCIFDLLKSIFVTHNIKITGLFNDLKTMRKNKKEIIRLANQLIKELEEDEKYWMENMPFEYVPKVPYDK